MRCRYCFCPAAGRIHRNAPTLKERIIKRFRKREEPDLIRIVDYYPAIYPTKSERPWENRRSGSQV